MLEIRNEVILRTGEWETVLDGKCFSPEISFLSEFWTITIARYNKFRADL